MPEASIEAGHPSDGVPGTLSVSIDALRQHSVAIVTPCYGNAFTEQYLLALLKTQARFNQLGLSLTTLFGRGASIERSRNQLVAQFLASEHLTHLLFIDADEGWEPDAVLRLLAIGHDVVGAPVRKKIEGKQAWNLNLLEGQLTRPLTIERGAFEVADIGTGFLMISRAALLRMCEAYPQLKIDDPGCEWAKHLYALFGRTLEDGHDRSEDYSFCRRWRAIGGRVWVDPDSEIVHVGQREWRGKLTESLFDSGDAGDAGSDPVPDGDVVADLGAGEPVSPVAAPALQRLSAGASLAQAVGLRLTPDGRRYLNMAAGQMEPAPFHFRWLLPRLLGTRTDAWCWASWVSLAATVPLVGLLALQWGSTTSHAVLAAALWAALPSVRFLVAAPVLVDAVAMMLAVGAAVVAPIEPVAAVALSVVAGMVSEKAPIFAACFAWNPLLLVGLVSPLARCAVRPGAVRDDDPLRHTLLQPLATGIASHAASWRDLATMLLPWGACLAALAAPDPRWIVPAVLAYGQMLLATDRVRLYQNAAPAVCIAAAMVIPTELALVALAAHLMNPFRGNGV